MLNTLDITKYITACADMAHISVVWEKGGCPRTNGKTMWLPMLDSADSERTAVELMQFVKHETAHIKYSDFAALLKYNPQGLLAFINNLLEDHRIDFINDSEYDGDRLNTEAFMSYYSEDLARRTDIGKEAKDTMMPLFAWDLGVRDDLWHHSIDPFTPYLSPEGEKILAKLKAGDYATVLRNIRTVSDKERAAVLVWDLACRILREVFESTPEKEAEKEKKKAEAEGGKGEAKGKGKGKAGKGKDGGMPMPYAEHEGEERSGVPMEGVGVGRYTPTPYADVASWDFTRKVATGGMSHMSANSYTESVTREILSESANSERLANNIRTQLQIINRDRYEYGKKKGKLNSSSLYRVGIKEARGYNERLFKEKIRNKVLDVAVQVLVDASGSMSGEPFRNASAAAVILNDVLGNTLNIPVEILAFTEDGRPSVNTMFILKQFDGRVAHTDLADYFGQVSQNLHDNVDGESILYGYNRIRNRKEKRKLMVVLSDGSPCGGRHRGDLRQYTQDVIKYVEGSRVELLGIGLDYEGVKKYYKRHACIPSGNAVESALLDLISNNILRSV